MGSFDEAEVCELVGLFILKLDYSPFSSNIEADRPGFLRVSEGKGEVINIHTNEGE
jgi:hypothetical protein